MIDIKKVEYSGKYNSHLRPITNTQIITVEISPTGSGKTHMYKDVPNTIMLMPTNALVRQHKGMVAPNNAKGDERTEWSQLITNRCDYMTYQKFLGHSKYEDLSKINIIIDEAHLVLSSNDKLHYELLAKLFERTIKYLELKLISATLRKDVLNLYNYNDNIEVNQYIKKDYSPKIQFTRNIPTIDESKSTLFFINSKDKMIQVRDYYLVKYPKMKIEMLSANEEIPDTSELTEFHLILSTCVLKQGYSINCHIDQVVIHNIYNAVGAMDIMQYMARPRINIPEVYVITASTHFTKNYKNMPSLFGLVSRVESKSFSEETYKANIALRINALLAEVQDEREKWNILSLCNYYENQMIMYELFSSYGAMEDSIKSIIPSAEVTIDDVTGGDNIKFTILNFKEILEELRVCRDLRTLRVELKSLIDLSTDDRVTAKLKKLLKIEPIIDFTRDRKRYDILDLIQVLQVLNESVRKQCKQHIQNIEKGVYEIRAKHDKRHLPAVGKTYKVSKLGRKLKLFIGKLGNIETLDILEKIYSFERYDEDGIIITERSRNKTDSVRITGEYPIEDSWYELGIGFHKTNFSTVRN